MEKQKNYKFEIIFLPILIIIFLIISITVYNIHLTKKQLEKQITDKRIEYFDIQKKSVYNKVQYLNSEIKIENNKIETNIKEELEEKINTAIKISKNTFNENKNLSKKQIVKILSKRLSLLSYNKNRGYYYILDKNNQLLEHPIKGMVGTSTNDVFDVDNINLSTKIRKGLKKGEVSFVKYHFYKPNNQKKKFLKIVAIKYFEPLDIIIGTGEYVDDAINEFKNDFIKKITQNNDMNKYVFVLDIHNINGGDSYATMLANVNRKELVGKVLDDEVKDSKGNFYRKEYLKILREKGEGFLNYWYKKPGVIEHKEKYTYFYLNKEWNWVVACGFYPDDLVSQIEKLNKQSSEYLEDLIRNSLFWGLIFSCVMILLSTIIFYKIQRRIGKDQKRLIQSQENLKKAQQISKIGSWSYNFDTNEIIFSDEIYEIFEIDKNSKKPTYELFLSFVHNDDKNRVNTVFEKLLKNKKSHEIIHRIKVKKKIKWVNNQSEVFIEKNNTIVIGTLQDITEKYEKDKKIEEQSKLLFNQSKMAAMGEMIENIAHQWRQPLSAISISASGMKLENDYNLLDSNKLTTGLDNIIDNTTYLSNTIEDFRKYFAKDKVRTKCNIKIVYQNTIKLLKSKFDSLDIEIIEDCEDLYCTTLENELVQCLMNIFNNAHDVLVKNGTSKKLIFVKIYKKYDNVIISITDNAGGINDEIIQKIFEPYFTTKHKAQGTGIGLYMTREIIVKHLGGFIKVRNVNLNFESVKYIGANFKISLPLDRK
ncbi:MAG: cache domain-containing protein [Arcobacter sp.]|uniref:sensor histidine kinase n=1 Tax=Arcobacter sp. TaxID=1872629 RepID=UPI003B00462C